MQDYAGQVQEVKLEMIVQASASFLQALIANKGVQEIIDIGFKFLGNPILVIDASYKVLAFTKNIQVDDPNWYLSEKNNYLEYKYISSEDMRKNFAEASKSNYPVLHKPKNKNFEVIHAAIGFDNKVIGYLIIPNHKKPFEEGDMELAQLLKNVLSLELQKNKFFQNSKGIIYEYFIADLLEGNVTDSRIIAERALSLNWVLHKNLYVLTIKKNKDKVDNLSHDGLSELIRNLIPGSRAVFYNNNIVVIISRKKTIFPETDFNNLLEFLKKNELIGGVSCCFHSPAEIRDHYHNSLIAIDLGSQMYKNQFLYYYEDIFFYHLLSQCSNQASLEAFCHPALFCLEEYDKRHGEDLLKCLYAYLRNDKNVARAAGSLGIHRNTMGYRIKRIIEIMNLNINAEDTAFHLLCSLKIREFMASTKAIPHGQKLCNKHP